MSGLAGTAVHEGVSKMMTSNGSKHTRKDGTLNAMLVQR